MNKLKNALGALGITRADIVLTTALLAFSVAAGCVIYALSPEPQYVSVNVGGVEICRLPLQNDVIYKISESNTIEISGGSVRMIYADCPDKICMHTGRISKSGQSIVCAPNRVVVSITGGGSGEFDVKTN